MTWLTILKAILVALATFISTGIPLFFKLRSAIKAAKAAQTEAEAEKAYNDMLTHAQEFIEAAEVAFEGYDKVMKAQGTSAGAMKKKDVTSALQVYALSHGYAYDAEFWSTKIDEIVQFTREVNANKVTASANVNASNATVNSTTAIRRF